ncbi:MAG: hypothetical protein P8J14_04985 [Emcibacteraceae bacterium]|nr:hypothetical protein [Emcibacteraceae bacterium]
MKYFVLLSAIFIFNAAAAQERILDTIEAGWQGKPVCVVLQEDEKMRMLTCTYPPGVGQDRHYHPPYMGYVLQGGTLKSTSASGTRESTSVTGTSFNSPGTEWHELVNVGETTVQFLAIESKN